MGIGDIQEKAAVTQTYRCQHFSVKEYKKEVAIVTFRQRNKDRYMSYSVSQYVVQN